MADWAYSALSRLKSKEGAEHEANQDRALKRRQVVSDAPHLWSQVYAIFEEEIDTFSQLRPDYLQMVPLNDGVVLASPDCEIQITFKPDTPRITYEAKTRPGRQPKGKGTYTFRVDNDDEAVWIVDENGNRLQPDIVAETILDHLIEE